jgi:hypothetical protein
MLSGYGQSNPQSAAVEVVEQSYRLLSGITGAGRLGLPLQSAKPLIKVAN